MIVFKLPIQAMQAGEAIQKAPLYILTTTAGITGMAPDGAGDGTILGAGMADGAGMLAGAGTADGAQVGDGVIL